MDNEIRDGRVDLLADFGQLQQRVEIVRRDLLDADWLRRVGRCGHGICFQRSDLPDLAHVLVRASRGGRDGAEARPVELRIPHGLDFARYSASPFVRGVGHRSETWTVIGMRHDIERRASSYSVTGMKARGALLRWWRGLRRCGNPPPFRIVRPFPLCQRLVDEMRERIDPRREVWRVWLRFRLALQRRLALG